MDEPDIRRLFANRHGPGNCNVVGASSVQFVGARRLGWTQTWGLPCERKGPLATAPAKPLIRPHFLIPKGSRSIWAKVLVAVLLVAAATMELRTSWLQSRLFSALARHATYSLQAGAAENIRYPSPAPYPDKLGYSKLPDYLPGLKRAGFVVAAQARASLISRVLSGLGLFPIYHEKPDAGLRILDQHDQPLYVSPRTERVYQKFEDIPPVLVRTLLFIENREMLDGDHPYLNPSIEWPRLAGAVLDLGMNAVRHGHRISGGSTLATQIEKLRYSPGGRTSSVFEKLRQMASASLRAYQDGEQTMEARKRIVRDYCNALPLAAMPGYGEVRGLGDGLWVWYGDDFKSVNRLLAARALSARRPSPAAALAYRRALSLLLAVNSPGAYLLRNPEALDARTDAYLNLLAKAGIIPAQLRDAASRFHGGLRDHAPAPPPASFVGRKGVDVFRRNLPSLLHTEGLYGLDRLDLTVRTTLDSQAQQAATRTLHEFLDAGFAAQNGLLGDHLLNGADPTSVIYSFVLYERGDGANLLRVETDSYDQPLSINDGTWLELGSTAKIRTLAHYLEIIQALHHDYAALAAAELSQLRAEPTDPLSKWAVDYLIGAPDRGLPAMLEAAMNRTYSASPAEGFFTGGGLQYFHNYDKDDDDRVLTVADAFERSVNLVFVRVMRDIVRYHEAHLPGDVPGSVRDMQNPERAEYLARFADIEGSTFLRSFWLKFRGLPPDAALEKLVSGIRPTPLRLAVIYRSVRPAADIHEFSAFLKQHLPNAAPSDSMLKALYDKYGPDKFNLEDRGYIARVHPLELWMLEYTTRHPDASLTQILRDGAKERQEVYGWLRKTRYSAAQDKRIQIVVERQAFAEIYKAWKRLGYPFDSLVPSYATALGSSGDNPAALSELAGIILNGGVRYPTIRIRQLRFGQGTPVETVANRRPEQGERVLSPAIAAILRREMLRVVERGTAARAFRSATLGNGVILPVGGKTGTGDNRITISGPDGRRLNSRVRNRTATFVFIIGDRYFGTLTAFVPGKEAANYDFTSALAVQAFKVLFPSCRSLIEGALGGSHAVGKSEKEPITAASPPSFGFVGTS